MGEYIEPSSTAWVTEEITKPGDAAWSDPITLPNFTDASHEEVLVLAWTLLLFRDTVHNEDGGFSWTSGADTLGSLLADVIESENTPLKEALRNIQNLSRSEKIENDRILLKNASPGKQVSKTNLVLFTH